MTNVRAGVRDLGDVKVERVEDPSAPKGRVVDDAASEMDAEARAAQALAVQRDWQPDLSGVQLHDDAAARASADAIGAAAYTRGSDVYLGSAFPKGTAEGDHVLAHELGHVEQGHPSSEIHRFPATALTQGPVDWSGATAAKLGGGVSGGVYSLVSTDGELRKVIVKPVIGESGLGTKETGESLQFGDKAMSEIFGISTSTSRVVNKGAEYKQILDLVAPHQPPRPTVTDDSSDEERQVADLWKPISSAKSFIVMGEVPGKSVASLAEDSATDPTAMTKLQHSILDPSFMAEVGRMCFGDMVLGNDDRMLVGAMNLGNIMVESQGEDPAKLFAIDTNAVLGTRYNPKDIVSTGNLSSPLMNFGDNAKKSTENRRGIFDAFFRTVIAKMTKGLEKVQPPPQGPTPVQLFEAMLDPERENLYAHFLAGWDDAMGSLNTLLSSQEGRDKLKGLTDEYAETGAKGDLQYDTLELNARLLTSGLSGESQEGIANEAALKKAISFDPAAVRPPLDESHHDMIQGPTSGALQTDYEKPASMPAPKKLSDARGSGRFRPGVYSDIVAGVAAARDEVNALGTKSRGVFNKKEVTRNRVRANDFVTSTFLVAPGATRNLEGLRTVEEHGEAAKMALGGAMPKSQAAAAASAVRKMMTSRAELEADQDQYDAVLARASRNVKKLRAKGQEHVKFRDSLSDHVSASGSAPLKYKNEQLSRMFDGVDLSGTLQQLQEKVRTQPSEEAKGKGRKPLIGSRGRR